MIYNTLNFNIIYYIYDKWQFIMISYLSLGVESSTVVIY